MNERNLGYDGAIVAVSALLCFIFYHIGFNKGTQSLPKSDPVVEVIIDTTRASMYKSQRDALKVELDSIKARRPKISKKYKDEKDNIPAIGDPKLDSAYRAALRHD